MALHFMSDKGATLLNGRYTTFAPKIDYRKSHGYLFVFTFVLEPVCTRRYRKSASFCQNLRGLADADLEVVQDRRQLNPICITHARTHAHAHTHVPKSVCLKRKKKNFVRVVF